MFIWAVRQVDTNTWFERFCFSDLKPVFRPGRVFGFLSEDMASECVRDIHKLAPELNVEIKKFAMEET